MIWRFAMQLERFKILKILSGRVLAVFYLLKTNTGLTRLFAFLYLSNLNIDIFQYVTQHSTCTNAPDKICSIRHSWTYTNVYIGIRSTCMYKCHLNRTAFIKARVAHSVEHQVTNLKVVGSGPTVGSNFSVCFFFLDALDALLVGRLVPNKWNQA